MPRFVCPGCGRAIHAEAYELPLTIECARCDTQFEARLRAMDGPADAEAESAAGRARTLGIAAAVGGGVLCLFLVLAFGAGGPATPGGAAGGGQDPGRPLTVRLKEAGASNFIWHDFAGQGHASNEYTFLNGPSFMVYLEVRNRHATRRAAYHGYGLHGHGVTLTDEHGNSYAQQHPPRPYRMEITGGGSGWGLQCDEVMIDPGAAVTDVMAFELPAKAATRLRLTLPGHNLGGGPDTVVELPAPRR
jgi:hypothetical protein